MPRRLRSQLALVIALAMAPAGAVGVVQATWSAAESVRQQEALLEKRLRVAALSERDALLEVRTAIAGVARDAGTVLATPERCAGALGRILEDFVLVRRVGLLDVHGQGMCGLPEWPVDRTISGWQEFAAWPRGAMVLQRLSDPSGGWSILVLHPTHERDPRSFAVAADLALPRFRTLLDKRDEDDLFGLVTADGVMLAGDVETAAKWLPRDLEDVLGRHSTSLEGISRSGERRFYLAEPLIDRQLWAVGSMPVDGFIGTLTGADGFSVLAPILLWIIAVVAAYISIDKLVTRHVGRLQRATTRIGGGDLATRIDELETAPSEIRSLGDSIREMAANLSDRDARLREMIERQQRLLVEVHHRVRNNLQMVTSLVSMQLRRAKTQPERAALRFLEDRIQSLAQVHQHLYDTEDMKLVPLDRLARDICERLKLTRAPAEASVRFRYDLEEVEVDPQIATPFALFLTEASSNALEHAVPATGQHEISVALRARENRFILEIWNAVTHAPKFAREGLGMRLLQSYAVQLGGSFDRIVDDAGFRIVLTAPVMPRAASDLQNVGRAPVH